MTTIETYEEQNGKVTHPNFKQAQETCGECLGVIQHDELYSELSLEQLEEVNQNGFVGLSWQEYYNSFVPDTWV